MRSEPNFASSGSRPSGSSDDAMRSARMLMLAHGERMTGPIPRIAASLAKQFTELGCKVDLQRWGGRGDREPFVAKVIRIPADIVRVGRRVADRDVDLVLIHTTHEWRALMRDVPLLAITRVLGMPAVVQLHGGWSGWLVAPGRPLFKLASNLLFRLSDAVLVLSSEAVDDCRRFYPSGTFYVLKNPLFRRLDAVPASLQQGERDPVILFLSRLVGTKGIFETLEAVALLRDRLSFRLRVVGAGPAAAAVADRVRALGLEERVELTGFVTGAGVADAYRSADVFVLPTHYEGLPVAILEALAAGLPIVTTRTAGMRDHLSEGVNALFVPPRSPQDLADALARLLEDAELRQRMSEANIVKAREFAPDVVARDYLAVVEEVLAETAR